MDWQLLFGAFVVLLLWSAYKEQRNITKYRQRISNRVNWKSWQKEDLERLKRQITVVEKRNMSLMVVLGSGGHTAEVIQVLRAFGENLVSIFLDPNKHPYAVERTCKVIYIVASSDKHSIGKALSLHESDGALASFSFQIMDIPRSRHVGQSYFSSIFTTVYSLVISCWKIMLSDAPDVLLCNGPGTCVPVVLITFIRNVFYNAGRQKRRTRLVFIESIARVRSLSLSGRILYPFVHRFLVQWPELVDKYPLVEYIGLCL